LKAWRRFSSPFPEGTHVRHCPSQKLFQMRATKRVLRATTILVLASILAILVLVLTKQTLSGPPNLFAYVRVGKRDAESPPPATDLLISNAGPVTVFFRIRSPAIVSSHRRPPWVRVVKGEIVEADDVSFGLGPEGIVVEARRRNTNLQQFLQGGLRAVKALIATHSLHLAKRTYKSAAAIYEFGEVYGLIGTSSEFLDRSASPKVIPVKLKLLAP
jgi:hypothetical protein